MPLIGYISVFSILLPFGAICLIRPKEMPAAPEFAFIIYITVAAITQWIQSAFAFQGMNNLWIAHFFIPIEFLLLAFCLWHFEPTYRTNMAAFILVAGSFIIYDQLFRSHLGSFSLPGLITEGMALFILSVRVFYLAVVRTVSYKDEFHFWVSAGMLVYFGMNSLVYLFFNFAGWEGQFILHSITNIFINIFFWRGYLCLVRRQRVASMLY